MNGSLAIDTTRFNRALLDFSRYSRKGGQEILMDAARNFVRRVIAITPPSQGKANPESRKRGETAIAADLARIFSPGSPDFIARFIDFNNGPVAQETFGHKGAAALGFIYTRALTRGEMTGWHASRRRKDGRVKNVNRDATTGLKKSDLRGLDVGLVVKSDYEWFKKTVQRNVGFLAAGWNRAAAGLGYKPPAWIRRHGEGAGSISIVLGSGVLRIVVSNDVKFSGNVKGLTRAVQIALDQQATAMERKVAYFIQKAGKGAGLK